MAVIIVIEDDNSLREAISGFLRLADHQVEEFSSLENVKKSLPHEKGHLIVTDVNLPDGDGFSFVKELRKKSDIPVIFISVRESETDRITGFEVGADDYLVKPFSPKELVLRINAILRRSMPKEPKIESQIWELSGQELVIDQKAHKAILNKRDVRLTAAEWKILLYLISNNKSVVTRSQILDRCLEYAFEGYDRTVDTHIKNLRSKLDSPNWIETVRGYGYRFAGKEPIISNAV